MGVKNLILTATVSEHIGVLFLVLVYLENPGFFDIVQNHWLLYSLCFLFYIKPEL